MRLELETVRTVISAAWSIVKASAELRVSPFERVAVGLPEKSPPCYGQSGHDAGKGYALSDFNYNHSFADLS